MMTRAAAVGLLSTIFCASLVACGSSGDDESMDMAVTGDPGGVTAGAGTPAGTPAGAAGSVQQCLHGVHVAQCHRQRIGGVFLGCRGQLQQGFHHMLYLQLICRTIADYSLLDLARSVLGHRQIGMRQPRELRR